MFIYTGLMLLPGSVIRQSKERALDSLKKKKKKNTKRRRRKKKGNMYRCKFTRIVILIIQI